MIPVAVTGDHASTTTSTHFGKDRVMRNTLYRRALLGLAAATLTAAACSDTSTTPSVRFAAGFAALSGGGQVDLPGAVLTDPLVVKVFDDQGQPFPGAPVSWTVTSGGGTLSNVQTVTGADGTASATYTLGAAAGDNVISVTEPNIQTVTFTVTGDPDASSGGAAHP
jgi:adhesin/invasin